MLGIVGTVGTAVGVFAGTNVDDIVVLAVLFALCRTAGSPRAGQIWAGQYAGVAVLVAVSSAAALGLAVVPDRWAGLLGLIPVALGVRGLIRTFGTGGGEDRSPVAATGWPAVAAVTAANGADNIAVYTPMFRSIGPADTVVTAGVFAVLIAVWCLAGSWLGGRPQVTAAVARFGHWLVPVVFIVIGLVIVLTSGIITERV